MFKRLRIIITLLLISIPMSTGAIELVIGEEEVDPGIVFIFEGAIKDHVMPDSMHLPEDQTNVHIEARVNWAEEGIPEGTPPGGFVPYLRITALITNNDTGLSTFVDLTPHINLIDNFHYARNISLPGNVDELYTVKFSITKPASTDLAMHKDWLDSYGSFLMENQIFEYDEVDFEEIANASRN
ncbi:MAG: iron transporter [Pseudomonadota bacterium]